MTPASIAADVSRQLNIRIEQHLRAVVKPRPWWMPTLVWRWLLRRMLVLEMTQPSMRFE
jgi:hypothetical protein